MSWWIKEHIAVNDAETQQLCSIEADNQPSLPAADQTATAGFIIVRGSSALVLDTGDSYIMNSVGTWVQQPSGVQLDLTGYATTQDLTDGLAAKVDTGTYTAGQAEQETEIGAVAALGAKNLLENTVAVGTQTIRTVSVTVNADGSVDIGTGTVTGGNLDLHINTSAGSGMIAGERYIMSGCPQGGSASTYRLNCTGVGYETGEGKEFVYGGGALDVYLRVYSGQTISSPMHWDPMIRRAEITDNTFVPYAPTNRELYEMILALQ